VLACGIRGASAAAGNGRACVRAVAAGAVYSTFLIVSTYMGL
jgi:hypothetical protein